MGLVSELVCGVGRWNSEVLGGRLCERIGV